MPRAVRSLALLCALGPGVVADLAAQARPVPPSAATVAAIDAWIDQVMATGATPGMAVAVVRGDSVLLVRGTGVADLATGRPVTDATRFYIASTTKAFTALTVAVLDGRGTLRLDAPLATLLPGVRLHAGLSPQAITLRDLLGMRSGIDEGPITYRTSYTGEHTAPALRALLAEHPPAATGRAFRYSNIGYVVAGLVLEHRVGKPWQDVVRETVLDPLGMASTSAAFSTVPSYHLAMPHEFVGGRLARIALLKSDRTIHAAGGHVTTAHDLARFLVAQLNGGRVRGQRGVPASAIAETHRRTVRQDRRSGFGHRTGWALGWDIATYQGVTLLERPGGFAGYASYLSLIPERRVGVAVVGNGGLDAAAAQVVAQGVYDLLLGRRDLAALAGLRDSLAARVARERSTSRDRAAAARVALPLPPPRYFGRFANASLGTLTLEGNAETLMVRLGDSWDIARGVAGADGAPARDSLAADVLGDEQRLALRFAPDGGALLEVRLLGYVFRRVEPATPR